MYILICIVSCRGASTPFPGSAPAGDAALADLAGSAHGAVIIIITITITIIIVVVVEVEEVIEVVVVVVVVAIILKDHINNNDQY